MVFVLSYFNIDLFQKSREGRHAWLDPSTCTHVQSLFVWDPLIFSTHLHLFMRPLVLSYSNNFPDVRYMPFSFLRNFKLNIHSRYTPQFLVAFPPKITYVFLGTRSIYLLQIPSSLMEICCVFLHVETSRRAISYYDLPVYTVNMLVLLCFRSVFERVWMQDTGRPGQWALCSGLWSLLCL